VVAIVIIILVPIVLVALGWLFVASQISDVDDERVTLNLASPDVMMRHIDGNPYWDAELEVNLLTPRDTVLSWASVMMVIKSSTGSVLLTSSPLLADHPPSYDDDTDGQVDVETWYVDLLGNFVVNPGDEIKITGMTSAYEGATVDITSFGERIGSITLPTDFP
jgi:hypothetical protein